MGDVVIFDIRTIHASFRYIFGMNECFG